MDLKTERANTLEHGRKIVDAAMAESRELTDAEFKSVEADLARVKQIDTQTKSPSMFDRVMELGRVPDGTARPDPDGGGNLFTPEVKSGFITAMRSRTAYRADLDRKALTVGTLLPPSGQGVEGGLYPNIYPVAELFRNEPAQGPTQRYYRLTAGTAEVVAEGDPKPDAGTAITPVDVTLKKIAAITKVSDELSEDAGFLIGFLGAELTSAVISVENAEIITALTASGILTDSGAAATVIDMVSEAVAAQESVSGLTPTAVLCHPNTVAAIRAMKASTAGSYHVDPWTAGPPSLHGLRLVSTPAVASSTVYVVASQAVVIYRRGAMQAEIGLDGTDFSSNLRTLRCELRMAPAVVRPSGIVKITLT